MTPCSAVCGARAAVPSLTTAYLHTSREYDEGCGLPIWLPDNHLTGAGVGHSEVRNIISFGTTG
jgi:hypothetical protein